MIRFRRQTPSTPGTHLINRILAIKDNPHQTRTLIHDLQQRRQQRGIGEHHPNGRLGERVLEAFGAEGGVCRGEGMAHSCEGVGEELPVQAVAESQPQSLKGGKQEDGLPGVRVYSDSFLAILVSPVVFPQSEMVQPRGDLLDAGVHVVVGRWFRIGEGEAAGRWVSHGLAFCDLLSRDVERLERLLSVPTTANANTSFPSTLALKVLHQNNAFPSPKYHHPCSDLSGRPLPVWFSSNCL
jgi:hypothetical protein